MVRYSINIYYAEIIIACQSNLKRRHGTWVKAAKGMCESCVYIPVLLSRLKAGLGLGYIPSRLQSRLVCGYAGMLVRLRQINTPQAGDTQYERLKVRCAVGCRGHRPINYWSSIIQESSKSFVRYSHSNYPSTFPFPVIDRNKVTDMILKIGAHSDPDLERL